MTLNLVDPKAQHRPCDRISEISIVLWPAIVRLVIGLRKTYVYRSLLLQSNESVGRDGRDHNMHALRAYRGWRENARINSVSATIVRNVLGALTIDRS
jgi:hypothetical protein